MKKTFIGREVEKDNHGFYIVFGERELMSRYDRHYEKIHFSTYREAVDYMLELHENGSYWFNAKFDPSI